MVFFVNAFMVMNSSIESVDRIFPGRSGDPAPPPKRIVDDLSTPVFKGRLEFCLGLAGSPLAHIGGDHAARAAQSSANAESVVAWLVIQAPIV
ncbi:hypothetical protein [Lacisediminihabitans sp. H27-G8]|uniref:hypothetical protein n=1 Tax=Lacisediminihabitans sp. H27-G8 TaxID=3111909 RepID=UPI0038FC0050